MRKISVSGYGYIDRLPLETSFEYLSRAGVQAVDFPLYQYVHKMTCSLSMNGDLDGNAHTVRSLAERYGLVIGQTHAPFCYIEECTREGIVKAYRDTVIATKLLGSEYVVMHPVKFGGCILDERRQECFDMNIELFREIKPILRETGVKVLLENMFAKRTENGYKRLYPTIYSTGEELARAADTLGEGFGVCLDIGHANITREDIPAMVRLLGDRIFALHIHDNTGDRDDHLPPYAGNIDFASAVAALKETGYRGNINFEVNFGNVPEEHLESGFRYLTEVGRAFRSALDGEEE